MASVRDLRSATLTELVERLEVEPRTMARMTRELRSKGFLQVPRSLPDRRSASIVLTAKGRRTLVKATALWQEAQAQLERRNDPTPDVYAS
jgi:DNA-binding MarR family transcriptional regulator